MRRGGSAHGGKPTEPILRLTATEPAATTLQDTRPDVPLPHLPTLAWVHTYMRYTCIDDLASLGPLRTFPYLVGIDAVSISHAWQPRHNAHGAVFAWVRNVHPPSCHEERVTARKHDVVVFFVLQRFILVGVVLRLSLSPH